MVRVEKNLLTWDSCGAKGPFVAGVGQYQHCPVVWELEGLRHRLAKPRFSQRTEGLMCAEKGDKYVPSSSLAACPPGSYKAKQGEGPCLPCPPNSRTTSPAASICTCHNNFYRADSDSADSACTSACAPLLYFRV